MRSYFITGIVFGIVILTGLLIITPMHKKNLELFDHKSEHNLVTAVSELVEDVANAFWVEKFDMKPSDSEVVNLALCSVLYVAASLGVIIFSLLAICYLLFYTLSFFIGALIGAIVGLVVVSLVSLFSVLGHSPAPEHLPLIRVIVVNSGIITVYLTHVLLIGMIFALIATRFEKRNSKGDDEMNNKKWDNDLPVPTNQNFMTPYTGNLNHLKLEMPKYDPDKGYLGTAFSGFKDGLKMSTYNRQLEKKAETWVHVERCLNAYYRAAVSYNKLKALDEIDALERARRNLDMLALMHEREIMIQLHQYELEYNMFLHWKRMSEIECEIMSIKRKQAEIFFGKEAEKKKDEKISKIEEIRDRCLIVKKTMDDIENMFKDEPLKGGAVIDSFIREMVEEGVIGDVN